MKAPFKLPIFVSDRTVLVADDAELICETEAAKSEELAYIVLAVNNHESLVRALQNVAGVLNSGGLRATGNPGTKHDTAVAIRCVHAALTKLQGAKS